MLQYFSVTGNTVFMCLSFVQPGQDGPLSILMYGFLISARPPLRNKAVLISKYTHTHNSSPETINTLTYNYNLQYAFPCLFVMYEFEPTEIHHVERVPLIIPQL